MRPVENAALIQRWVEESGVRGYFDTPHLVFQAYSFEKGEYITSPDVPMDKLLFCIRGTIQIYGIRDDGGISIGLARSPAILGDVEFGNGENPRSSPRRKQMPFAWRFPHGSTLSSSTGTCGSCTACCGSMGKSWNVFPPKA